MVAKNASFYSAKLFQKFDDLLVLFVFRGMNMLPTVIPKIGA